MWRISYQRQVGLNKLKSLITSFLLRHVITAAHCLTEHDVTGEPDYFFDNITVILGKKVILNFELKCNRISTYVSNC